MSCHTQWCHHSYFWYWECHVALAGRHSGTLQRQSWCQSWVLCISGGQCVVKMVMHLDSRCSSSWWYPAFRSSMENTTAPFKSWRRWSIVGVMCWSRCIAVFGRRISIHRQTLSGFLGFGVTTIGDTHGVRPLTLSMIPFSCSSSSSLSTFFRMWNGILLCSCITGCTESSTCNFTWKSLIFPMPWKRSWYSWMIWSGDEESVVWISVDMEFTIFNRPRAVAVLRLSS